MKTDSYKLIVMLIVAVAVLMGTIGVNMGVILTNANMSLLGYALMIFLDLTAIGCIMFVTHVALSDAGIKPKKVSDTKKY